MNPQSLLTNAMEGFENQNLNTGDPNADVYGNGWKPGDANLEYNPELEAYQKEHGLNVDGIYGEETYNHFNPPTNNQTTPIDPIQDPTAPEDPNASSGLLGAASANKPKGFEFQSWDYKPFRGF
jgi:hypothetical protein